jgi:hypothetical protein
MGVKRLETSEEKEARLTKNRDVYWRLEKLKKSREKRKALETVQERNLRLQQMKEATERLNSNGTSTR